MEQEKKEPFELFKVLGKNLFRSLSFMANLEEVQYNYIQYYFFNKEIDRLHEELNEAEKKVKQYKPEQELTTRSEFIQVYINQQKK